MSMVMSMISMKNILRKSVFCAGIFTCLSSLMIFTGCDAQLEPPDTLEGILNIPSPEQETVPAETERAVPVADDHPEATTEYQSIFFQPVTEAVTEPAPETQAVSEYIPETRQTVSNWEEAYYLFLKNAGYENQLADESNTMDVKFLLLYLDDDDIPELFIQTTSTAYLYRYNGLQVIWADSIPVSNYSYNFFYRPYRSCICTMQGSVMADGTYLAVREYEPSATEKSGLAIRSEYCYPTREYSYEVYSEMGMNIDMDRAPLLDIHMDRENNLGSSWFTVPDVLDAGSSLCRYEITTENLTAVFGIAEDPADLENPQQEDDPGNPALRNYKAKESIKN